MLERLGWSRKEGVHGGDDDVDQGDVGDGDGDGEVLSAVALDRNSTCGH